MTFKVRAFSGTENEAAEWDDFVWHKSLNGTLFHTQKFLTYHPEGRFDNASFVVESDGDVVARITATIVDTPEGLVLSSHQGASYGGPVVAPNISIADSCQVVDAIVEHGRSLGVREIRITQPPDIYLSQPSHHIEYALGRAGFVISRQEFTSVVPFCHEERDTLALFNQGCRSAVKKGRTMGVEVVETDKFEEYNEILTSNLRMRHNVKPTHTLDELMLLKELFPTKIRLFGAFLGSKMIAGVCNFTANDRVVLAFYISHIHDYQSYRPVNVLFYEILRRMATEGFRYLDYGLYTIRGTPNWGLARFKESFGARGVFRNNYSFFLDR